MDTVRADHLSAYGYERETTPNVDALAQRSVLFENAISQSSWTLPAHGAMMTGLYPGRLGVSHYPAKRTLPDDVPTLAAVFSSAGYETGGFTGGGFVSQHFGFNRGFDSYTSDGRRYEHNIDEALGWVDRNKDKRFFLFFHGYNAHRPYYSEPEDKRAIGVKVGGASEKRGFCVRGRREQPEPKELESIVGFYDAAVHMGDRYVGRLLDALRDHHLMDNTVILVTSDHGEEFFEHGNCDHVRFLYREVINVPYILYVPKLTPAGKRIKDIVPASISVARTLLDVVGADHEMPGVSLMPMLLGQHDLFGAVFSEAGSVMGVLGSRGDTIAMTGDRYKLISYLEEGTDEAYDTDEDLHEQHVLPEAHDTYARRPTLRAWYAALSPLERETTIVRRDRATSDLVAESREGLKSRHPSGEAAAGREPERPSVAKADSKSAAKTERASTPKADSEAAARVARTVKKSVPPAKAQAQAPAKTDDKKSEEDSELELPAEVKDQLRSLGYMEGE